MAKSIYLILIVAALSAQSCPKYTCGPDSAFQSNQCIVSDETHNTLYLKPCSSNGTKTYCDPITDAESQAITCMAPPAPQAVLKYPGEACTANNQCLSNKCNKRCIGISLGQTCGTSGDDTTACDVGLYCNNQDVCAEQIKVNQTGCETDTDCVNYAWCSHSGSLTNGTCKAYFSVNNGPVTDCSTSIPTPNVNYGCKTGFCVVVEAATDSFACVPPPAVKNGYKSTCSGDSDCTSKTSYNGKDYTFNGTCTCGINPYGDSYCSLNRGDEPFAKVLDYTRELALSKSSQGVCYTGQRFSDSCFKMVLSADEYSDYEEAFLYYTNFATIYNEGECAKRIYNQDYWMLNGGGGSDTDDDSDDSDDDFAIITSLLTLAFIF